MIIKISQRTQENTGRQIMERMHVSIEHSGMAAIFGVGDGTSDDPSDEKNDDTGDEEKDDPSIHKNTKE